jgi:hypothetical protein
MALEPGVREVDGAFRERLVEVASPDQSEINDITGEPEQEPFAGIELPRSKPDISDADVVTTTSDTGSSVAEVSRFLMTCPLKSFVPMDPALAAKLGYSTIAR